MTPALDISPQLSLPLDAVTETFAILAKRGAGKSNAAVVMAEEMHDHGLPWVAIDPKGDWWGIRAAGDGKSPGLPVVVFGGLHGDVPLEPSSGQVVADLVAEHRLTCVLDVSEMTKADQRRFLTTFADRLYRTNREPLHIFCEEADEYVPQMVRGESAKVVEAFERLVKRGRFRGIGVTLITQRSASLNKDVLTQIETLVPMRTPSPQDRKAILAWVELHDSGRDAVDQLPNLGSGEAFVFSPQWLDTLARIQFRRRRTFDSGATPTVGGKPRPPATLADVDLDAIRDSMAATIEKAEADDPKRLRREVARLTKELDAARFERTVPEVVEVPAVSEEMAQRLTDALEALSSVVSDLSGALGAVQPAPVRSTVPRPTLVRPTPTAPRPRASTPRRVDVDPDVRLGKTERVLLSVLVQHGPRTHSQLALLSGYSPKASTIGVALGKMRKAGLVAEGQPITATDEGAAWLGDDVEPLPEGEALIDYWRDKFGMTERRVLDAMLSAFPNESSQAEVAELTGYSPTASTIGVALGKLRKVGVVDRWRISDDFAEMAGLV